MLHREIVSLELLRIFERIVANDNEIHFNFARKVREEKFFAKHAFIHKSKTVRLHFTLNLDSS